MASTTAKVIFRILLLVLLLLAVFYVGRPLYWKISTTVSDIRHSKQTVKQGLSQIVLEAQRWYYNDESDSGIPGERVGSVSTRKLLSLLIAQRRN